jgi:hypothetical protein
LTARKRVREAARKLGLDPSADNYVALAREHVVTGDTHEVLRVCTEGLEIHPGDANLLRMAERARMMQLDTRVRTLHDDLRISPRPALWREMCEVLLECGRHEKAERTAEEWHEKTKDGEALFYRARCRAELFFQARRAVDGQLAYDMASQSQRQLAGDPRPLRLQLDITERCRAWNEARTAVARLLELHPGNPELEARFRCVLARVSTAKPLHLALAEVERTGNLEGDTPERSSTQANFAVRPLLQALGAEPGVRAAVYQRGGTALVQGLHGATADRTARAVREVVHASRDTARRMSLGQPQEVVMEGDFGTLYLRPGPAGSVAVWTEGRIQRGHEKLLDTIAGAAGQADGGRR